ncbi:MAG: class I SAM-dependent DNA methyltransferase, partial [Sphingomonas bacterium]|nr:class I SAM-dependent DNA methyltransferase [Sphingomonas bacterium]
FTNFLTRMQKRPENFAPNLSSLWQAMDKGGLAGVLGDAGETVLRFNGYLFKDTTAIALNADEIGLLIEAATHKWNHVEPAIFGTLLERALDGKERAKLGAHYTPRAYVERLVMPTIMEPLRADWAGVQAAAGQLIEVGKADEAHAVIEKFHAQLAQTKVLDPACGTGNFLYVALARMKELEGEVIGRLAELAPDGEKQTVAELSGHTITPENFLGIEINPRAAAIAQLVLWIGYLQWHFRVNGEGKVPPEPVLRDVKTIENRDALITWDKKVLERDEQGRPLTRWDGETMKVHPVTGKKVPDEDAQVEVERYVTPKAAKWPKTNFIVGNPPFIGGKDVRERLGGGYFDALFKTTDVPESADFVMHWWDKAALAVRKDKTRRFGFVTTNSITQVFSRRVIARHLDAKDRVSLLFAIPNHPWVDEKDGAAVRIAMTVAAKGKAEGRVLDVADESGAPDLLVFIEKAGAISSDLRTGADVTATVALKANSELCSPGVKLHGDGFIVTPGQAAALGSAKEASHIRTGAADETQVMFDYRNGRDLASHPRGVKVIDLYGLTEAEVRDRHPAVYQHVATTVKPHREQNNRASYRDNWWLFGEPRSELRRAMAGVTRYIATIETAKHRVFQFLPMSILPDNKLACIALDDAYFLGVLSSRFHVPWAIESGGRLGMGDDPVYVKSRCFDPFPFPADVSEPLKASIRAEAEALDGLRKQVLAAHDDLTLTGLYNVLEALKAGRALTDKERDIHDRGLVTLIRQHHDAIDALVAKAYGWPADLSDEDILTRLVALNKARAAEEARGVIRWLRPAFQAPGAEAPKVNATLDLGDAPAPAPATVLSWPKTLAEQVSAVAAILAAAPAAQHPRDIARAFDGKRAASVTPVLDALAAIGQARKLADGRYAA